MQVKHLSAILEACNPEDTVYLALDKEGAKSSKLGGIGSYSAYGTFEKLHIPTSFLESKSCEDDRPVVVLWPDYEDV